jgi:hypothetical protein
VGELLEEGILDGRSRLDAWLATKVQRRVSDAQPSPFRHNYDLSKTHFKMPRCDTENTHMPKTGNQQVVLV